jgi:IS1 family transposase
MKKGCQGRPEGCWRRVTWTSLDADTKLIVSYLVGSRDAACANDFMQDAAARLANQVQLTTDAFRAYPRLSPITVLN